MAQSGFRLWLMAVIAATGVVLVIGHLLRMRFPASTADPIAQAIGFTTSFAVAWPWFRAHNPRQLSFPIHFGVIAALAFVIAIVRIRYVA
jgi:hypothetical protein